MAQRFERLEEDGCVHPRFDHRFRIPQGLRSVFGRVVEQHGIHAGCVRRSLDRAGNIFAEGVAGKRTGVTDEQAAPAVHRAVTLVVATPDVSAFRERAQQPVNGEPLNSCFLSYFLDGRRVFGALDCFEHG
jgi:hypothetical protein